MKHTKNMKKKMIGKILFFWIPFLMLLSISLLLMYHARFITNTYAHHFEKQLLWFSIGFLLLFLFKWIPIKKIFSLSIPIYLINLLFLILVLIIGTNVNGAKAWIDFHYFSFQPSELMKFSLALFLADFCSHKKCQNYKEEFILLLEVFILTIIPSILVFLEPDTGSILFYFCIALAILWNKVHKRWFVIIGLLAISLFGTFFYLFFFQKDLLISFIGTSIFYRVDRLLNLGSGMQIENALIALGSAPFMRWNLTETGIYIPEAPTDFVFALTSNVFGIIGNLFIIFLFLILDFYLLTFMKKEKDQTKKLFSISFLSIFISSQIISIAMNLGLFPIIGIPLPFVSYGGSSTIVLFLFLSIFFSKNRKGKKKKQVTIEVLVI